MMTQIRLDGLEAIFLTLADAKKLVRLAMGNFPTMQDRDMADTVKLWAIMLGDMPYAVAEAALVKVLVTSRFWPTAAEIRDAAQSLTEQDEYPNAEDAWIEVLRKLNPYAKPQWSNELIKKAVESVGYLTLCHSENITWERSQFMRTYEQYRQRKRDEKVNDDVLQLAQPLTNKLALSMPQQWRANDEHGFDRSRLQARD